MKTSICLMMLIFASASCFASDYTDAWIKKHVGNKRTAEFKGKALLNRPCALYLTDVSGDGKIFYVVVGYEKSADMNDYIGVVTTKAETKVATYSFGSLLSFNSAESWGNESTRNKVTIRVSPNDSPVSASGVSDLKWISCTLDPVQP